MTSVTAVETDPFNVPEESIIPTDEQKNKNVSPLEYKTNEHTRSKDLEASNCAEAEQSKDGLESIEEMVSVKTSEENSEASSQYSTELGN